MTNRIHRAWGPFWRAFVTTGMAWSALLVGWAQGPAKIDTLSSGVFYQRYLIDGPVSADVVTVDLRDTAIALEAFQLHGLVPTSEQLRVLSDSGRHVLSGVNADFFSFQTGWPVGNTVMNWELVLGLPSKRSHFLVSGRVRPYIERIAFFGAVLTSKGGTLPLWSVNSGASADQARFYSSRFGSDTGSDTAGVRILLRKQQGSLAANDTTWFLVTGRLGSGKAVIPQDGGILVVPDEVLARSGGGLFVGDTVAVVVVFKPVTAHVAQVLGGAGRILRDGRCDTLENLSAENLALKFQNDRHPRTFVGFDRDTTRLFLCTVDGRQESSRGMTFSEMADFLLSLGAWNAINFDGGGSTTMVVNGRVVNSPSDKTGERPVANVLAVVKIVNSSLMERK